jgi:alkylhydroperoxidase/carboxymuconolactone decarboxylase family protein YurZ
MADQMHTPVLELLGNMTAESMSASSLDPESLMLARIAALIAVDAPPASYLLNLRAAGELGVDADQVVGVMTAVAPIVGTARVASAAGKLVRALGLADELSELAAMAEE